MSHRQPRTHAGQQVWTTLTADEVERLDRLAKERTILGASLTRPQLIAALVRRALVAAESEG